MNGIEYFTYISNLFAPIDRDRAYSIDISTKDTIIKKYRVVEEYIHKEEPAYTMYVEVKNIWPNILDFLYKNNYIGV